MNIEVHEVFHPVDDNYLDTQNLNVSVAIKASTDEPDGVEVLAYRGIAVGPCVRLDNRGGVLTVSIWKSTERHLGKPGQQITVE